MRARQIIDNLLKLAIAGACVYAFTVWQGTETQDSGLEEFAEAACVDEIGIRYDVGSIRAYDVEETSNGYTVRATAKSARGAPVKIVCVTNEHGGVRDIAIDER